VKRPRADDVAGLLIGLTLVAAFLAPLCLMGAADTKEFVTDVLTDSNVPGGPWGRRLLVSVMLFTPIAGGLLAARSLAGLRDSARGLR
jgi:hypothetical protein